METDETRDRRKKNIVELTRCSVSDYRAMPKLPLRVMADNIRSMYNVGAIFRTADAFASRRSFLQAFPAVRLIRRYPRLPSERRSRWRGVMSVTP